MLAKSDADMRKLICREVMDYLHDPKQVKNEYRSEVYSYLVSRMQKFRHAIPLNTMSLNPLQEDDVRKLFEYLAIEMDGDRKIVRKHQELIAEGAISILYNPQAFDDTIRQLADELDKALARHGFPSPRMAKAAPSEPAAVQATHPAPVPEPAAVQEERPAPVPEPDEAAATQQEVAAAQEADQAENAHVVRTGRRQSVADIYRAIVELLVNRYPERLDDLIDGKTILAENEAGKLSLHQHRCAANGRVYYISTHSSTKEKGRQLMNRILPVFGISVPSHLQPLDNEEKLEALLTHLRETDEPAPTSRAAQEEVAAGGNAEDTGEARRERSELSDQTVYLDILARVLEDWLNEEQVNEAIENRSLQLYRNQEEALAHTKWRTVPLSVRGRDMIVGVNISTKDKVRRVEMLLRQFGLDRRIDLNYPEGSEPREKLLFVRDQLLVRKA
jgi:hypothetical protein